jgi:hypothetical protein
VLHPPGGGTNIVGRILGDKLHRSLGQPIVIDNRAALAEYPAPNWPPGDPGRLYAGVGADLIDPSICAKLAPIRLLLLRS